MLKVPWIINFSQICIKSITCVCEEGSLVTILLGSLPRWLSKVRRLLIKIVVGYWKLQHYHLHNYFIHTFTHYFGEPHLPALVYLEGPFLDFHSYSFKWTSSLTFLETFGRLFIFPTFLLSSYTPLG